MFPRVFIGPMSKNIVDAIINSKQNIGLIPSRRQVEHTGGYVNNWTTKSLSLYVKNCIILRDHAGPLQGDKPDDGTQSIIEDAKYFNGIHIDPWKKATSIYEGIQMTSYLMGLSNAINPNLFFEVGTEEAIFKYSPNEFNCFLGGLQIMVPDLFKKIKYAVIQCGTKLQSDKNLGEFDKDRLSEFLKVCNKYNILSKEHNGDYQSIKSMEEKKALGLYSINIAPEFGMIESSTIYNALLKGGHTDQIELFFQLCLETGRWKKWVPADYDPYSHKEEVIKFAGHYAYSHNDFYKVTTGIPNLELEIKDQLMKRINELIEVWDDKSDTLRP